MRNSSNAAIAGNNDTPGGRRDRPSLQNITSAGQEY
jgi:hypothetical protein